MKATVVAAAICTIAMVASAVGWAIDTGLLLMVADHLVLLHAVLIPASVAYAAIELCGALGALSKAMDKRLALAHARIDHGKRRMELLQEEIDERNKKKDDLKAQHHLYWAHLAAMPKRREELIEKLRGEENAISAENSDLQGLHDYLKRTWEEERDVLHSMENAGDHSNESVSTAEG